MRLDGKFVPVSCFAKYLGIYFDSCLTWKSHLAYLEAKTTQKLSILSTMAGSTWGVNTNDLRRKYISTVLSQFLYCVSVWFVSSRGHRFKGKEDRTLALIRRIEAREEKIISRAFRRSAGAALDIDLFLRPVNLQLDIFLHDAFLRIVTGLTDKYITQCRRTSSQPSNLGATTKETQQHFTRLSPFHKLEIRFTAIYHHNLKTLERRIPFPTLPWYKPLTVHISASAELAISNHNFLMISGNYLTIYTDGRRINGRIRAFAVTMLSPWPGASPLIAREKRAYIGSDQQFTVYFGELYGLLMALDLVVEDKSNQKILIFTDNQAAITSSEQPKQQSGQYLL